MEVYVVTKGSYSDYGIDRIFINKQKAEEYAEWLENSNEVEVYEINDDIEFEKNHKIQLVLDYCKNGKEKISWLTYKVNKSDFWNKGYTLVDDFFYEHDGTIRIKLSRLVNNQNFDEEFYKNKFTKAAYDFLAIVKQKISEGYSIKEINTLLGNMTKDID